MDTKELRSALEKLGDDPDASAVAGVFQSKSREVYQEVFNAGHASAVGAERSKVEEAEAAQKKAEGQVSVREGKISALEADRPDVAKIRDEYQDEIQKLKTDHKDEIDGEREKGKSLKRTNTRKDLIRALTSDPYHIDPDYAEVLAAREDVRGRITVDDEGEVIVHQKGKQIPIAPSDDHTPVQLFAEELAGGVAAKWKTATADSGSGVSTDRGGAAGTGGDRYTKMREKQKAIEKERGAGADRKSAKEKMGLVR